MTIKPNHNGAKRGRGYWGRKKEAKKKSKKKRRMNDRQELTPEAQFGLTPGSRSKIDTQVTNTGVRNPDDQSKMRYLKVV